MKKSQIWSNSFWTQQIISRTTSFNWTINKRTWRKPSNYTSSSINKTRKTKHFCCRYFKYKTFRRWNPKTYWRTTPSCRMGSWYTYFKIFKRNSSAKRKKSCNCGMACKFSNIKRSSCWLCLIYWWKINWNYWGKGLRKKCLFNYRQSM